MVRSVPPSRHCFSPALVAGVTPVILRGERAPRPSLDFNLPDLYHVGRTTLLIYVQRS
jgi:hypothetical protein